MFHRLILEHAMVHSLRNFHLISYKHGSVETADHFAELAKLLALPHRYQVDVLFDEVDQQILPAGLRHVARICHILSGQLFSKGCLTRG